MQPETAPKVYANCLECREPMIGITTHAIRNKHNCCGGKHLTKYPRRGDPDYAERTAYGKVRA